MPVMTTAKLPPGVDAVVVTLRVVWPEPLRVEVPNAAVTPAGAAMTETVRSTVPLKPLAGAMLTVPLTDSPGVMLATAGDAVRVKLGAALRLAGARVLSMDEPLGVPHPEVRS